MGLFDVFKKREDKSTLEIETLLKRYQITEYLNGAYRAVPDNYKDKMTELVTDSYPSFKDGFLPFGLTWLGNCLAVDLRPQRYGQILLFEIGTQEVLDIPVTIPEFFETEMVEYSDAVLASSFYDSWLSQGGEKPNDKQCIGYKVPLFLGGADEIQNLELSDLEVYWGLLGQIKFPFEDAPNTAAITCCHVMEEQAPILYVSHDEEDGMWQFLCGKQHNDSEAKMVSLYSICMMDKSVAEVAKMPCGCCVERENEHSQWSVRKVE